MIITYTKRNEFGGFNHEIEFTPTLKLFFKELDSQTINVEFIEKRIFGKDKKIFTFISHQPLVGTVIAAFSEIMFPVRHTRDYDINLQKLNQLVDQILEFMAEHKKEISKSSIVQFDKER